MVTAATRLVHARGATVGLLKDDAAHITVAATAGEPFAENTPTNGDVRPEIPPHPAITEVLTRGKPVQFVAGPPNCPARTGAAMLDTGWAEPLWRVIAVPMFVDQVPIGVLYVHDVAARGFTDDDVRLIQSLANQGALAIAHARLLTRGNDAAVLEERARLARDLHDSVTQSLFSLGMLARAAHVQHERNDRRLHDTLERVASLSRETLVEMRALLFELHPQSLVEKGLAQALADLVAAVGRDGGPTPTFTASTNRQPAPAVTVTLFRIAQEALANVRKHAQASSILVSLADVDAQLVLTIADDGVGFDPTATSHVSGEGGSGGVGLRSMRERAATAGVALVVRSKPGEGITIYVTSPITDAAPE